MPFFIGRLYPESPLHRTTDGRIRSSVAAGGRIQVGVPLVLAASVDPAPYATREAAEVGLGDIDFDGKLEVVEAESRGRAGRQLTRPLPGQQLPGIERIVMALEKQGLLIGDKYWHRR